MVRVWSVGLRAFHWLLAIGFTYQFFNESGDDIHSWIGYALVLMVVGRIVYGLKTSNPYEKWEHFKVSPTRFLSALKATLTGKDKRELGHPPQAAFVMMGLFIFIILTSLTGHLMEIYFFFGEDWAALLHEIMAWTTVALVVAHILGVFHASWTWKENLVASMIHGKRRKQD